MYTMNFVRPHMDRACGFPPIFDDRFFRNMMEPMGHPMGFRVDIREKDDRYELIADVPGVDEDKISVSVEDDVLVITADRDNEFKDERNVRSERHFGHMERRFELDGIDQEKIEAAIKNGVLYVNLPKVKPEEQKTARKIEIRKA